MGIKAADEIEQMAALAQSDAEPVQEWAAQICDDYARRFAMGRPYPQFKEIEVAFKEAAEQIRNLTAPPRPDASAGLIEALQQIIDNCDCNSAPQCRHDLALKFVREIALKAIRARAADRSGK